MTLSDLNIAIAQEWIAARAGSEKVFEAMSEALPQADLYALTYDPTVRLETGGRQVHTSFLDAHPLLRDHREISLPLMPLAWRRIAAKKSYDIVVTSSHACAKGFRPGRSSLHLSYVHSPMRYAWTPQLDGRGQSPFFAPARAELRRWDKRSTRWVDDFAANSSAVAARVQDFYERDARVIPPPVDTAFFSEPPLHESVRSGLLAVGRLIPYKGFDLAIKVAAATGEALTIVGRGPEEAKLRAMAAEAGAPVHFETSANDTRLRQYFRSARLLIFPTVEDFGIVPVEAQAAGLPVIGPRRGGLLDTVIHGETGVLVDPMSIAAFADACVQFRSSSSTVEACVTNASQFSEAQFRRRFLRWVSDCGGAL